MALPLTYYLRVIWYYKRWVLGGALLCTVGMWGYLQFIPDEYKAESEFIPPALIPVPRQLELGEGKDLERVASLLQSQSVRDSLTTHFSLVTHYKLDKLTGGGLQDALIKKFRQNTRIQITPNGTIRIQVYDTDPQTAQAMVEFLVNYAKNFCKEILAREKTLATLKHQLQSIDTRIDSLEKTVNQLRTQYKIFNVEEGILTENTIVRNLISQPQALSHYDKLVGLQRAIENLQDHRTEILRNYNELEVKLQLFPEVITFIQPPTTYLNPARPKRWLYILTTFVVSLLMISFLTLYGYELGLWGKINVSSLIAETS
ncbi:MAG: hypothetical protein ACUVRD_09025 [Bacteroidia bacterium]